jgi:hypothetical protein
VTQGAIAILAALALAGCERLPGGTDGFGASRQQLDAGPCTDTTDLSAGFEDAGFGPFLAFQHKSGGLVSDQFQILDASVGPVREGLYSARFIVRPGDTFGGVISERASLLREDLTGGEGDDYYLAWSSWFPIGWAPASNLRIIKIEDNGAGSGTPGPINVVVGRTNCLINLDIRDEIAGTALGRDLVVVPADAGLKTGVWHDFVLHVRFSYRPDAGLVEAWHRTEDEAALTQVFSQVAPTLNRLADGGVGAGGLLFGLLRPTSSVTDSVIHDGMRRGPSFCSVVDGFPEPLGPDAGTPDASTSDAGTPDAGAPDAGGAPDASQADSGTPDAGKQNGDPVSLSVQCGCSATGLPAFGMLLLLAFGVLRGSGRSRS